MLCLSRRNMESVIVDCPDGEQIKVMVRKGASQSPVAIGIEAPKDYRISREELWTPEGERRTDRPT